MKKLVKVEEIEGEGLLALMGERVMVFACNYIYAGTLAGVNDTCILLEDAGIVYETGAFTDLKFKDYQRVSDVLYIQNDSIESFCKTNKD